MNNLREPFYKKAEDLHFEVMQEILSPLPGIQLPDWPAFSKVTGGFRPKEFSIFCGSTGTGKTQFLANVSLQLAQQEIPHGVFSVETGNVDWMKRVYSAQCGVDLNTGDDPDERTVKLIESNENKFHQLAKKQIYLSLYEDRFSVEQLISDIKYMVDRYKIKVAFVDNLNFIMEITADSKQILEMDRVIHELIIFCKQTPVHVVMVMHPKKTDGGRVESEFDVKGSSTSVQESSNIFLYNRPKDDQVGRTGITIFDRELVVKKSRKRGMAVNTKFFFSCLNGVKYAERGHSK